MTEILSIAMILALGTSLIVVGLWRNTVCQGPMGVSFFTFMAILFTSGLDVGLIMFPLVDYAIYAEDDVYAFTNPLAIEFGFWGFLVWGFYFLTTFYFCIVEPKLKLFEIRVIKMVNNLVVIATCAFTAYLFFSYLPDYISGVSETQRYGLVAIVILAAALSSSDIRFVRILSVGSTWLFLLLIAGLWWMSAQGLQGLLSAVGSLSDYFVHLHRFVLPMSDYHEFYLYWWFAWSIMIGQFVARFTGGIKAWHLFIALLVVPSIPIGIWFSVLYTYYSGNLEVAGAGRLAMVVVGVIFVINSLDSLTRLYTQNMGMTRDRLGLPLYVVFNFVVLAGLVLLYQLTPLKIEWIGLLVIGLYIAVYVLVFLRRDLLRSD